MSPSYYLSCSYSSEVSKLAAYLELLSQYRRASFTTYHDTMLSELADKLMNLAIDDTIPVLEKYSRFFLAMIAHIRNFEQMIDDELPISDTLLR